MSINSRHPGESIMSNIHFKRRLALTLSFLLLVIIQLPVVLGEGIELNGIVDEAEWEPFLADTSQKPYFNVSGYMDSEYLYIAVTTDDVNQNDDVLEFAFRAEKCDYWIQVKPELSQRYRPSGGTYKDWWKGIRSGLPVGVNITAGETDGKRSYEISIKISKLSKAPTDLEDFVLWLKVQDGEPDGPINYYPDSRAGWWFEVEVHEEEDDMIPMFHIPEMPLGTIMVIVSMFTAMILLKKQRIQI